MIHSNIQCTVTELENMYIIIVLDTPIVHNYRGLYRCIMIEAILT